MAGRREHDAAERGAAERRRLEAIAFGPDSDPAAAAAARLALAGPDGSAGRAPGLQTVPDAAAPPDRGNGAIARESIVPRADPAGETMLSRADAPATATAHPAPAKATAGRRPGARRWVAIGAGVAVLAAVAFGGGLAVGRIGHATSTTAAERSAKDASDGQITLEQFLAARQTFADQLPGGIQAPVVLHSTRLVWTNRSLSADDAQTPWDVYVAVGTDRSLVCLIASPDGLTATETCASKDDALHGSMTLVAQAASGTLTVRAVDGVVTGAVAPPS